MITDRTAPIELVFYSAPECHLCEIGLARTGELAAELGISVRVVDISKDPGLENRYRSRIPVGEIGGRTAFKYEVDEIRVRRLVAEARSDQEGRSGR
ncbi:MAG: glutaredoxin family protein [Thermoleophilia bacterium]